MRSAILKPSLFLFCSEKCCYVFKGVKTVHLNIKKIILAVNFFVSIALKMRVLTFFGGLEGKEGMLCTHNTIKK
jgi:hypothetical protein